MTTPTLLIALVVVSIALLIPLAVRPAAATNLSGRVLAFLAVVALPIVAGLAGLEEHVERSKTVAFCTSCHVMERYGQSLHVDDIDHLPATHYQYNRVPRETACFACHTHYTMYGDWNAKMRGLRHVWVQYFGRIPAKIHLYQPYHNRECLHCHEGARSFVEAVSHRSEPGRIEAILDNRQSCLAVGCHPTVHTVDKLDGLAAWPAEKK